jgi:hypothetical protein
VRNQHETEELLDKSSTPTIVLVGREDTAVSDTGNHDAASDPCAAIVHTQFFKVCLRLYRVS